MKSIIFTPESIRAILDGKKTQTRRMLKDPARPRYVAGDTVYAKETWAPADFLFDGVERVPAQCIAYVDETARYCRDSVLEEWVSADTTYWNWRKVKWCSPLMMPEWASRLRLSIASVRAELASAITEDDARAEGVEPIRFHMPGQGPDDEARGRDYRHAFKQAWEAMHGPDAWDAMVWRIEFRVVPR